MKILRQPIVTVCGHVDHGKTSLLDRIRGTSIQETEAGGITQKISFTTIDSDTIKERSGKTLEKFNIPLNIPGLLFIDTPGHAAFTNLRKRGGSLADIAVLVIDINDGIKPQTSEVLQILKANKTPFIIALNKIDNISGWKTAKSFLSIDSVKNQVEMVKNNFDEKFYTIMGSLQSYGINAELYSEIKDFTKSVAIVPCSARSGEGITEILAMITALSQRFLEDQIEVKEEGKGVVLEIKKEKTGTYLECILYDGKLKVSDEIVIASFDSPIITKVKTIMEAKNFTLSENKVKNNEGVKFFPKKLNKGFGSRDSVEAATGIRIQVNAKEDILPGMPFQVVNKNLKEIESEFKHEISESLETDKTGIIVKADSLGSLEALLYLLKQKQIRVIKADIGPITKKDIYSANALPNEDKVILGFNIEISPEAQTEKDTAVKIITDPVVYKLIENFEEWKSNRAKELERQKLDSLPALVKITILNFVFRNSNPAVFGVRVDGGKLKKGERLINIRDEKIGQVKEIQHEKTSVQESTKGQEIAISVPGVNFERQLTVGESLFTTLSETEFRQFKANKELLTSEEKSVLQEIAQIKRKENPTWGV